MPFDTVIFDIVGGKYIEFLNTLKNHFISEEGVIKFLKDCFTFD